MLRRLLSTVGDAAMSKTPPKNPLIVVLGATGTGKSQLAVDLANRYNGEIINGDAMQMYDGLPIITNKITVEEQQGVPHHLLGFIALNEEPWIVGKFKNRAGKIIQQIRSRGRVPIVVGGTHYYTQSLLFEDALVQDKLGGVEESRRPWLSDQEISSKFPILDGPTEVIIEKLKEVDPIMANRWHPNDRRKIRRSLEIFLLSGRKASDIYAEQKEAKGWNLELDDPLGVKPQPLSETVLFWVHSEPEILKKRLDNRVDKMLEAGLLNEIKAMYEFLCTEEAFGVKVHRTSGIWASIGWKEFEPYLAALKSEEETQITLSDLYERSVEQTKAATRQYAKRQTRWIRLKLLPALSDQNALGQLYLLDGSDIDLWADNVSRPASKIIDSFLAGQELLPPAEMSDVAKQYLRAEESTESDNLPILQACEICNTTCAGDNQWQAHLSSRRHRALVRKRKRNPHGMSSNPNNEKSTSSRNTH